jgi:hypothetical protein
MAGRRKSPRAKPAGASYRGYALYGCCILILFGYAHHRGWNLGSGDSGSGAHGSGSRWSWGGSSWGGGFHK